MDKKMNNKGFSLVELIVVIAIMAVLVGVLAPQFIKYVEKSRQSTDISNLDSIKQVVEAYYADKETLPTTVTVEIATSGSSKIFVCKADGSDKSDPVLKEGGVQNTKIKGSWTTLTATWTTANNKWTYTVGGNKLYYKVENDQIVPE